MPNRKLEKLERDIRFFHKNPTIDNAINLFSCYIKPYQRQTIFEMLCNNNYLPIAKWYFEKYPNMYLDMVFNKSIYNNNFELAKWLNELGGFIGTTTRFRDYYELSCNNKLFIIACSNRNLDMVKWMLKIEPSLYNNAMRINFWYSVLELLANNKDETNSDEFLQWLLQKFLNKKRSKFVDINNIANILFYKGFTEISKWFSLLYSIPMNDEFI